jgi:hypothetical protein
LFQKRHDRSITKRLTERSACPPTDVYAPTVWRDETSCVLEMKLAPKPA